MPLLQGIGEMKMYSKSEIEEMVFVAKRLGSYRKAAEELGINPETVRYHCHKNGVHFEGPHERCKRKKQKVVEGHVFYWSEKGYYRGSVNGERLMLSDYMYRKIHGTDKPKGTVIRFRDGNTENYDLENVYFVSTSEFMRERNQDPEIHEKNKALLDKGRIDNIEHEKKRPWLKKRRMARTWATRRENDPEGISIRKMAETRRRNAEARGFWYTDEQLKRMSEAHKGKTHAIVMASRHEAEKAAIRRKMGMD